ncbi:MAG: hydroxyacid dehydrogenase [Bacillota bacterium]|nr:hydroxyacid dehydrogenase [Bacillota bacterium]
MTDRQPLVPAVSHPRILVAAPDNELWNSFLLPQHKQRIATIGEVSWNPLAREWTREELAAQLPGHDVVMTTWSAKRLDAELLAAAPELKLVAHLGGSVADVTSPELYARGIRVITANRAFAQSVADGVIAYIGAAARQIPQYHARVLSEGWRTETYRNSGLLDKRVGLVGFGAIARELVPLLRPFNTTILAYDRYVDAKEMEAYGVRAAGLEEIFSSCDIVSLHLPRTPETHGLIGQELLDLLSDDAIFINTARADVVDEAALNRTLTGRPIRALLDVHHQEPLRADSPLRQAENVILMPHMAGPTIDRRPVCAQIVIEDLERWTRGEALREEIGPRTASRMTQEGHYWQTPQGE